MPVLEADDAKLAYDLAGKGDCVVFVSGLGGTAGFWNDQVAVFAPSFRILTFDHRGVGRSTGAPPYSVRQWSDDVAALIDREQVERIHLVGHSTGGVIAQLFAAEHPDRVRSLVLGGTWLAPDRRFRDLFEFRKELLSTLGGRAYRLLADLLSFPAPDATATAGTAMTDSECEIVAARIDALLAYDGTDIAPRIVAPTFVIGADDDYIVPVLHSQAVADAIPHARLLRFRDGGHFFPKTRAEAFNAALRAFWSEAGR